MSRYSIWSQLLILAGVILVLFGWRCLNYTKVSAWEHHTSFAVDHGLPKPSEQIFFAGAISLLIGGGLVGYSVGNRP